jgi:peptidoglycan hydrolase-like protein with peptidoglycan-binding domain
MERGASEVDRRPRILQRLGWSHRDAVGFVIALIASIVILINTLFLQHGPHPAPLERNGVVGAVTAPTAPMLAGASVALPRPSTPVVEAAKSAPPQPTPSGPSSTSSPATVGRANAAVVTEIQRELSRRGFYDGVLDGKYGPKTDAAIRDFEHATGLRPSAEPNEALLRAIKTSSIRSRPATAARPQNSSARPDPIAEYLAPSRQVIAVQRALSEFGYGQIKPTGLIDPETQSAIERFERERRLPVTGQLSHRVVRELAAITGRPLE